MRYYVLLSRPPTLVSASALLERCKASPTGKSTARPYARHAAECRSPRARRAQQGRAARVVAGAVRKGQEFSRFPFFSEAARARKALRSARDSNELHKDLFPPDGKVRASFAGVRGLGPLKARNGADASRRLITGPADNPSAILAVLAHRHPAD